MSEHAIRVAVLVLAITVSDAAQASGFAIAERDAEGLGRAFSGRAAVTGAASISDNPAALPQALTLRASLSGIGNDVKATDSAGNSARGGEDALIPAAYAAWKGAGIGIDAPFGLSTSYPKDWSGRYAALHSEITAARFTVGIGRDVGGGWRIGAATFAQHLSAELSSAAPIAPGLDGYLEVEGSDTGFGVSLGSLWRPREGLTIGAAYTSPVWHELTGDADLPSALGRRADTRVKVVTPESIRLGINWKAAARWRLLAGAEWTRWSRLQTLDIRLSNGLTLSEEHGWRDTWRLSLGGEHRHVPWTLRAGLAWDQSPVRDAAHRYPRLPDADRTWLAAGLGYHAEPWQFDAGFSHLFVAERGGEHPRISYESATSILSASLTYRW